MVLPRPATRCFKASHHLPLRTSKVPLRPSIWQRSSRRKYSSSAEGDSHGSHKKSSEIPWMIGSVGITLPCIWYLAQPQLNKKPHGGDHGHDSHTTGDEHGDKPHEGEEGGEDATPEAAEETGSDDGEEKKGDEGSDADGQKEDADSQESSDDGEKQTEDASKDDQTDEGDGEAPEKKNREYSVTKEKSTSEGLEGVQFKGATKAGKDGKQTHTEKHIPDHKGFNKKRLESDYGKTLGQAENDEQSADDQDLGAASKSPGGFNTMSGKQEGLANTDTKHSTDITQSPDKSKKGDGSAETSKQKGTVDPSRQLR